MKPPKFRITKVKCCYTCETSKHGLDVLACRRNSTDVFGKKVSAGVSPIGICKLYKQRKSIGLSKEIWCGDNINDN